MSSRIIRHLITAHISFLSVSYISSSLYSVEPHSLSHCVKSLIMPAKKRKGSGKQADTKAKQPKQDGQKAVSHDINVPIDEGFNEDGEICFHVLCHAIIPSLPIKFPDLSPLVLSSLEIIEKNSSFRLYQALFGEVLILFRL